MTWLSASPAQLFERPIEGVVESLITGYSPGRVQAMGTSWTGRLCVPDPHRQLRRGTRVYVVGRTENTLWILPCYD